MQDTNDNHNMLFVRNVLKGTREVLMSVMCNDWFREAIAAAIDQVAISTPMVQTIPKAFISWWEHHDTGGIT